MPLEVAVVIVSYRCAELTVECLRSVAAERATPGLRIRAIVIDNASGDAPIISRAVESNGWTWVALIESPRNGGFAYGTNLGFRRAYEEGPPDYLHMLNPDTVVHPGAIGALVRFLGTKPRAGIVGGSFENADGSNWPMAFRFPTLLSEVEQGLQFGLATRGLRRWVVAREMPPVEQPVDWVAGASMMVRRAVVDAIGGLDENYFLYFDEIDFCRRAKRAGFETWYAPQSRVMHIAGQSTKVTERNASLKRLPPYWFESRRRYFATTYGLRYAAAVDIVALLAHAFGTVKRFLQGRPERGVPHFMSDLARHSVLRRRNRCLPALKCFAPAS